MYLRTYMMAVTHRLKNALLATWGEDGEGWGNGKHRVGTERPGLSSTLWKFVHRDIGELKRCQKIFCWNQVCEGWQRVCWRECGGSSYFYHQFYRRFLQQLEICSGEHQHRMPVSMCYPSVFRIMKLHGQGWDHHFRRRGHECTLRPVLWSLGVVYGDRW